MQNKLEVNQKIDLVVEDGPYKGTYLSKVAEINSNYIKVTAPFANGEIVPLRINQVVKVLYTGLTAAYMFDSRVISRESEPVALISITSPAEIIRIQRREFFRVEAKKGVKYRLSSGLQNIKKSKEKFTETVTVDISGGGVKIVVDEKFPSWGKVELYLDLPGIRKEIIYGEITNLYDLPDGKAAGIRFTDIDDYVRERIITWLFNYQRELRQKGLL